MTENRIGYGREAIQVLALAVYVEDLKGKILLGHQTFASPQAVRARGGPTIIRVRENERGFWERIDDKGLEDKKTTE